MLNIYLLSIYLFYVEQLPSEVHKPSIRLYRYSIERMFSDFVGLRLPVTISKGAHMATGTYALTWSPLHWLPFVDLSGYLDLLNFYYV